MTQFSEIANRIPINRSTLNVASEGNHFAFDPKRLNKVRTDAPPAIISGQLKSEEELTGLVRGRLTVIGRSLEAWVKSKKIRWVVRCTCGFYERMRSTTIKTLASQDEMCSACKLLEQRKLGYGPWSRTEKGERVPVSSDDLFITPIITDNPHPRTRLRRERLLKTPIPPEIRWLVWERDNFTCQHCGSRKHLAVDHILAESKGGMMVLANLQTLCGRCNSKKGAR